MTETPSPGLSLIKKLLRSPSINLFGFLLLLLYNFFYDCQGFPPLVSANEVVKQCTVLEDEIKPGY